MESPHLLNLRVRMEKSLVYFWIIALSSKALSIFPQIKMYLVSLSHNFDFEGKRLVEDQLHFVGMKEKR